MDFPSFLVTIGGGLLITLLIVLLVLWTLLPIWLRSHLQSLQRETAATRAAIQTLNANLLAYGQSMERHLAALHSPSPPRGEGWGLPDIAPRATAGEDSGQGIEILD